MTTALDGVCVVELASYVAGPFAGSLLADLGARVIKVEPPGRGDPFRGWSENDYSPMFCSLNRNKESVAVDLRAEAGRRLLRRLLAGADVLIENYRPGVPERLGFGYESLRADHPRLIYCSISGFGGDGPYRERPGYDTVGQGLAGLLSLVTDLDAPRPAGFAFSDHLTGIYAAYGVLAALAARERTGCGQRVETSLLQATLAFIGENAAAYFASARVPDRETRVRIAQVYAFLGGDNLPFVLHLSSPQKFWQGLVTAVERPAWLTDPRFADRDARVRNYRQLSAELATVFAARPRADWLERLQANDVPSAAINTLEEAFADPQVRHLGLRVTTEHPLQGAVEMVGPGVRLEGTPAGIRSAAPVLGEHTDAVLRQLGLGDDEREELRASGVTASHPEGAA